MDNYGTPESDLLKEVIKAGFKPIGITVMMCEETFIFKSDKEAKEAAKLFMPEGWWYGFPEFLDAEKWYVEKMLDVSKIIDYSLDVHWLDSNFAPKPQIEP